MSQDLDSVPTRAELGFPVYQERGSDLNVDVGHGDAGYSSETEPSSPSPAMDEESSTEVPVQILEHASSESEPAASVQQGGPAVPDTTHHPTDSSAQATTTLAFDPEVVLAMHYQLNEKNFALLQEGTEVMQISEEIGRSASSGLECTICLDAIESGQMMTKVPCDGGHKFHSECLNRSSLLLPHPEFSFACSHLGALVANLGQSCLGKRVKVRLSEWCVSAGGWGRSCSMRSLPSAPTATSRSSSLSAPANQNGEVSSQPLATMFVGMVYALTKSP